MFGAGEVKLPCSYAGKQDTCKLDTGANVSTISPGGGLLKGEDSHILATSTYTTASGATKECNFIELFDLNIGHYTIEKLTPVSCSLNEGEKGKNLIGLDAFADQKIYLDYKNKKIIVGYEPPKNKELHPYEVDSVGHILIPTHILNGTKTMAMFDTGAALTVVAHQFIEENSDKFSVLESTPVGKDSFGNPLEMKKTISSLKIAGETYIAEYIMGIDFSAIHQNAGSEVNYILGHNVISQNNWFFDLKNRTWYVE